MPCVHDYTSSPLPDLPGDTPPQGSLTWETLRTEWSPRAEIRIDRDRDHRYVDAPAGTERPQQPHALYLADKRGRFRLLGFDFDDHNSEHHPQVDAAALQALLEIAGVPHLVCSSGPGSGIHIWVRLATPTPASAVKKLAKTLAGAFTSYDATPLVNAKTGCLRAPGSPHRAGGHSVPLNNDEVLPVEFDHVVRALSGLTSPSTAAPAAADETATWLQPIDTTPDGAPRLRGPRRPLPPQFRALARRPLGIADDASAIAWSLLLACAHARHTQEDVQHAAFDARWPGLEYLRTSSQDGHRAPRADQEQFLARQWEKAVAAAAAVPARCDTGSDAWRAAAAHVAAAQQEADARPERWTGCTGVIDRLIVDALCWRLRQAASAAVHLSERAWALLAGLDRSTVNRRLGALMRDGWIVRVEEAAGPWAARWTVRAGGGKEGSGPNPGEVTRALADRLDTAREDVWNAPGIGHTAWAVWRAVCAGARTVAQLCTATGLSRTTVSEKLGALRAVRLLDGTGRRAYTGRRRLSEAAKALGVRGAHDDKVRLYALHSATFVWWLTDRLRDHLSGPSDALAEWGHYPNELIVADTDPRDVAMTYGGTSLGPPPEATTWSAAMVMQEQFRHRDPGYWSELVAEARAALPPAEAYGPAVLSLAA